MFQFPLPPTIQTSLLIMNGTVHFDDESMFSTIEINDEESNSGLPAELQSSEVPVSQDGPECLFRGSLPLSERSCPSDGLGEALGEDVLFFHRDISNTSLSLERERVRVRIEMQKGESAFNKP